MKILADATLPLVTYNPFFQYNVYYNDRDLHQQLKSHDLLLCRSTLKVTPHLLSNTKIQCVATASSGTDHIDKQYLKEKNITLFDAKGCNARSVANYVMSCLAALRLHNYDLGNNIGIIGMGAVGTIVCEQLLSVGFNMSCYDPLHPPPNHACTLQELQRCNILLVHANLHNINPFPSYDLLNDDFLKNSQATVIINAARGNIVNENAILARKSIIYCTDVYANEPAINPQIVQHATICTPHIAGHSVEAKYAIMLHIKHCIHKKYHITLPENSNDQQLTTINRTDDWEKTVLQIYDPFVETDALKTSSNYQETFLSLRQQHQFRHEFLVLPD